MSSERDAKPESVLLRKKCRICNAEPGVRCGSIVDASKYLDVPHADRIKSARSEA